MPQYDKFITATGLQQVGDHAMFFFVVVVVVVVFFCGGGLSFPLCFQINNECS